MRLERPVRFQGLTAVKISALFSRVVKSCGLVNTQVPAFRRKAPPSSSELSASSSLKKEAVCFSETLVSTYETTRRHNPEEQRRHYRNVF
jgi:hypothetical protein